jgi:hypothetical protein
MVNVKECFFCRRPQALRNLLVKQGDGRFYCKTCMEDVKAARPVGSTAARRSFAVTTLACPHCGAARGVLCTGPGVVRFLHARRRDAAVELLRDSRRTRPMATDQKARAMITCDCESTCNVLIAAHQRAIRAEARVEALRSVSAELLGALEVVYERAAEVGWIDKDQQVEARVERARRALEVKP